MTETDNNDLQPCPFCGGGSFRWHETPLTLQPDMSGKPSSIVSVELVHGCGDRPEQVFAAGVSVRAKTRALVVEWWNRRAGE